ncbi:Coatomer, gamma subunit [Massarina eburnea CBS 473.64]|uniref:Coatomer subunit gamma n=1 Tax=Massarina eburnea CBS 473.64 TaxID=1395130 RepID=A0A6A6S5B8_9PLEO|nr:Coatomer, gamma subunit [Massarina eburnea CBS 473.64]
MDKKHEDVGGVAQIDKTSVFQEARVFSASPISPRKCRVILTKLALLLFTGENWGRQEATTLFFGISKLFQNKDASLRQMVYLVIKELAGSADDVIMVTASIMKDTSVGSDVVYRPNAIRALCRVIDASTVQAIERLVKTCIVDKNPSVSSAALVSSYHLLPVAKDVVRRWQSEATEAAAGNKSGGGFLGGFGGGSHNTLQTSSNYMTQYHAIGLLYQMRASDRMSLVKMVQQYSKPGEVKSPAATVLLVRLAAKLAAEDPNLRKPMMQLLDGWLRHKAEMVNFEAAKAICDMRDVNDAELVQAVHVLQLFLTSPRAVTKFAALRILSTMASFKPDAVRTCNQDIESLITNSNRSIATFAITTLLKTGNESSVDRLMKQITGFMAEITDEFKVTIVEAVRTLALKFKAKQSGFLTFLSGILRDEGGYDFKRAVVEAIMDLIRFVPDAKEDALATLCEFIEDCEFTKLAVRILFVLGREGPSTPHPTKYIRYIYNRVVLENAIVRAAATSALAKFGVGQKNAEVKKSVHVLLTRCLDDVDDEVRDRAALNLRLMETEDDVAISFVRNDSMYSLPVLEHQLAMYVSSDSRDTFEAAFDITKVPSVSREQADAADLTKKTEGTTPTLKAPSASKAPAKSGADAVASATAAAQKYAEELQKIPELAAHGAVLKSSSPVELTEPDTEYVVTAIKHIFKDHIVLQYDVKNTLPDTVLVDVTMGVTPEDDGDVQLEEEFIIPAPRLNTNEPGTIYVSFKRLETESRFVASSFTNVLNFTTKEIDPSTNEPEEGEGYPDEYQIEDLDLNGSDYVVPAFAGSFDNVWEQSNGETATETLQLSNMKSISDATDQLIKTLSLQPLEGTDVPLSTSTHTLKLYGKTITGGKVAGMVRMAFSARTGVTMKIEARSEEEGVAALVVGSVA